MPNGQDIFGYSRNPKPAGAFSTENSLLTFGNINAGGDSNATLGLLVQNWNIGYAQNVQEIFELGSNRLYWSKGRPQGQGTLQRVVGFAPALTGGQDQSFMLFPPSAYDVCLGGCMFKMTAAGGNCDAEQAKAGDKLQFGKTYQLAITMDGCLVMSIGYGATVNDTRIMENLVWRFAWLDVSSQLGTGGQA